MRSWLLMLAVVTAVCGSGPDSDTFRALTGEYWEWRLMTAPEFATSINVNNYNDKAESYSMQALEDKKTKVDGFAARLAAIDVTRLDAEERVSYYVLNDTLHTVIAGYKWRFYGALNPVNFLEGLWADPRSTAFAGKFTVKKDLEDFIKRIDAWAAEFDNMIERMREAIFHSTTDNWVSEAEVLKQIEKAVGVSDADHYLFYEPFNGTLDKMADVPDNEKTILREDAKRAIDGYLKSLKNLSDFLTTDYRKASRQSYAVSSFQDGQDFYRACLRWHLSVDITPEEVHQKGLDEVARISQQMRKVIDKLGHTGMSVADFFAMLRNDSRFVIDSADGVLNRFRSIIKDRIAPKLPKMFKNIPDKAVTVKAMPNNGPGGSYMAGSPDGSRPGVFLANVHRPRDNPTYDMVALTLHEADPGHHLQDIYAQASPTMPVYRKVMDYTKYFSVPYHFPFYTAYTEGWALYSEGLGEELDIYEDDYELMGRYGSEIFRACRLVVDTGLHYYNWTRDEAVAYMLNYTGYSKAGLTLEVDRYITWPGQACAYKIGELKIRELRAKAESELGPDVFDIRDFHYLVLNNGAVPLSVLEDLVNNWITTVKYTPVSRASVEFRDLTEEYWRWRLEDAPELATSININTYNNKAESYSLQALETKKTKVQEYFDRLKAIDESLLDEEDMVSYEVLYDTLKTVLDGYKWRFYGPSNPVNFMEGIWSDPRTFAFAGKFTSIKDLEDFIERIMGWTTELGNMKRRMKKSMLENTTNHWVSMVKVPKQIKKSLVDDPVEFVFYEPFNEILDGMTTVPESKKDDLRSRAVQTITDFLDGLRNLSTFVTKEYKGSTRKDFGVGSLKNGKDYYRACLRWHLSVDMAPEAVHQKGLEEVERITTEMRKIIDRLGHPGLNVSEFFSRMKNDSQFYITDAEATLQGYRTIIKDRVGPELSRYFKDIPSMPVSVEAMPYDGAGAQYKFGAPDGSRPGLFQVNVLQPTPTFDMVALALHEADPGHHLQDSYSQASKTLPEYRKVVDDSKYFSSPYHFPIYTAYLEGWALYSESLGEELGIYKNDYEMMGRYGSEIFRACRLVVDTGLHYFNWTRDQAVDYMLKYTGYSRASMTTEIDRYITWPGQACAYKIGELKIRELREKAKQELGDAFDIRDFHFLVLNVGAVPLAVLEKSVNKWITSMKTDDNKKLEIILKDFWNWRLQRSPEFATISGSYKYNDRLESLNFTLYADAASKAASFLEELRTIKTDELSSGRLISWQLLEDQLKTFVDGYSWWDYGSLNPFNFLDGIYTDPGQMVIGMPMDTRGDFINYVRRLELVPNQFDEMIELAREAIKRGHTNTNFSMTRMGEQFDKTIVDNPAESAFYEPFNKSAEKLFGEDRSKIDMRLKSAIRNVMKKFKESKKFITEDYMPHTRNSLGVWGLPRGREYYEACLKWHTSLDTITPEAVHTTGIEEVKRISENMRNTMNKLNFPINQSIRQFYEHLEKNTSFLINDPAKTRERYRDIIFKRIQPKLKDYFKNMPGLPLEVRRSPSDGIGGSYMTGTADGTVPGIFYVNDRDPKDNPTYMMVSLSLHEAIPGHHLAETSRLVADLPDFRKYMEWRAYSAPFFFPFYNSYVEGWALYSEYLGEEMGIYENDYELMGRYSDEMLRACRLVVDTGMHYFNWTRDEAITYITDYTALTTRMAAIEVDRYATWPGQACGYKIGEMKIKELRKKASDALGDLFDIRDFHYVVLNNGPMPLTVLEKVVDDWVASVSSAHVPPTAPPQRPDCVSGAKSTFVASRFLFVVIVIHSFRKLLYI